jgi:colanic acid biosynthesis glycosyl transferase WcaI
VSIPSRLYNLLAVGRAIIVAAEPQSEAALVVEEEGIGWVVAPEDPRSLVKAIRSAAADRAETERKGRRAATTAQKYGEGVALARYRQVVRDIQDRRSSS